MSDPLNEALLKASLAMAVPLRILEIRNLTFSERKEIAEKALPMICEHGDDIIFRSVKKGGTAAAWGSLVSALAVLAYQPGGVKFLGDRFDAEEILKTSRGF